jgi:TolB-like protein/Tfp pilus assembly protein PilF
VTDRKFFVFKFGNIKVTEREFVLVKDGETVPVEPKAFRVLLFLLRNPGRLVTKDEILKAVWNDCSVSDNSLTRSIATLRRLLGDDTHEPRYIATVPTVGYRFVCQVDASEETLSTPASPDLIQSFTGTWNEEVSKRGPSPGSEFLDSIAVLPFENAGDDPEMDYLSDGITASIINNLSQVHRLRVVPRTTISRYKGKLSDLTQAWRELRVRVLLTGRVSQRGDALSINVELIDTANESQLWGAHLNGNSEDIFAIQAEIAAQVTNRLKLRLNDEEKKQLTKRPTASREAYHLLLKSLYWANKWTPDGIQKGVDYARQAIDVDPVYAEAWTALAYLFVLIGFFGGAPSTEIFPRAKAAAAKALDIDDGDVGAHATLAYVRLVYDWDWQGAQAELLRALELCPNLAGGHYVYSHWYLTQGLYQEAMREAKVALDLDPLSVQFHYQVGAIHFFSRQYDHAIEQFHETNELDPLFAPAHQFLGFAYARKGMRREAILEIEKGLKLANNDLRSKAVSGVVSVLTGRPVEAREILDELRQESGPPNFSFAYYCAALHALLGEKDEAFAYLEKARQGRALALAYLAVAPEFESLRDDPRFRDVLLSMGFPAGGRGHRGKV